MRYLLAALQGDETVDLDIAVLEDPALNRAACLATLDEWAAEIRRRVPPEAGGAAFLTTANQYLFGELGLRGEEADYYRPRNSCLSHAIQQRRGLPMTLSVLYMEIARRCHRPVFGIGLPAHFVTLYHDGLVSAFVDVFHGGRLLTRAGCVHLVSRLTGRPVLDQDNMFARLSRRDILSRMLANLRGSYSARGELFKLLKVLELMLASRPPPAVADELAAQLHSIKSQTAMLN